MSRPVGGILSSPRRAWVAIHLSGLPGEPSLSGGGRAAHFPRLALLRVGFTEPPRSPSALVRSYRTVSPLPVRARRPAIGGFLSVALSCGSPRLAVSQHPALWSPDLPRHDPAVRPVPRPPGRLTVTLNSATTWPVKVTGQRIGRVSAMSGGPVSSSTPRLRPRPPPRSTGPRPAAPSRRTAAGSTPSAASTSRSRARSTRPFPATAISGSAARSSTSRTTARATST